MRKYQARRAGMRWREGAPEYILDCLDNRGKSADRFTVMFRSFESLNGYYVPYLAMDETPTSPQGISLWCEMKAHEAAAYRYRAKRERVRWLDLPQNIREHVIARYTEEWCPLMVGFEL